jgi:diadenylate cyclase
MLRGIIILAIIGLALLSLLPLNTFNWLLRSLLLAGAVALPMIFQDELRRGLIGLGQIGHRRKGMFSAHDQLSEVVVEAAIQLAGRSEGALIVLEGKTPLAEIIATGIPLQADVLSPELLVTIFHPKTPLHDGAVILRDNRLIAASCILPVQTEETGKQHLGTRHRAALGLSSLVPDTLIVVVSEERGIVSVAQGGHLYQDLAEEEVKSWLNRFRDQTVGQRRIRWRRLLGKNPVSSLRNALIALGLALVAWVSVIYQMDPPRQVTLTNVTLTLASPASDLVLMSDIPETITVQVQTTRDHLATLDAKSVRAELNLATMTTGTHRVPIGVTLADRQAQLVSQSPNFLDVTLEPRATITLTPSIVIPDSDSLPLGYATGILNLTPAVIIVQGPLSMVNQVSEAQAELMLNGRYTSFQQNLTPMLLDENGQRVEGLKPSPETIQVEIPIQNIFYTREIAIQATLDTDSLGSNFKVTGMNLSPTSVTLTGNRAAIDNAGDFLVTAPINLTNIYDNLVVDIPLVLPDGTLAVDKDGKSVSSVIAQVMVEPVTDYLVLSLVPKISNLSPALSIQHISPAKINVLLIGPQPLIDQVRDEPGLVVLILDLTAYFAGSHTLPLDVQSPESLRAEIFPDQVQIILVETGE